MTSSLCLVEYSSSDDSDENEATEKLFNTSSEKSCRERLPVPKDIQSLFSGKQSNNFEDPTEHRGRIRSFPHEEGNWATSVYVPTPFEDDDDFFKLQEQLFSCLQPFEMNKMDDYHISLSRTVAIRHHWIQEMKHSLEKQFTKVLPCACEIDGVKLYINDEKTRSFLGLQVTASDEQLLQYVDIVDKCFEGYKLAKYYQPPSFHISIGWCLGDVSDRVTKPMLQKMSEVLNVCVTELDNGGFLNVDKVVLKTGNKEFIFNLS